MSQQREPADRDQVPAAREEQPGDRSDDPGRGEHETGSREIIADLRDQAETLQDQLLRALAEGDNLRKRTARDVERASAECRADAARRWLPVIDNLDRALAHGGADPGSILDGIRAVRDQAAEVLAGLGFPRRDSPGEPFDPVRHEAVATRPADGVPDGTVVEVVRPGYGDGVHQLRPAQVVVAKAA